MPSERWGRSYAVFKGHTPFPCQTTQYSWRLPRDQSCTRPSPPPSAVAWCCQRPLCENASRENRGTETRAGDSSRAIQVRDETLSKTAIETSREIARRVIPVWLQPFRPALRFSGHGGASCLESNTGPSVRHGRFGAAVGAWKDAHLEPAARDPTARHASDYTLDACCGQAPRLHPPHKHPPLVHASERRLPTEPAVEIRFSLVHPRLTVQSSNARGPRGFSMERRALGTWLESRLSMTSPGKQPLQESRGRTYPLPPDQFRSEFEHLRREPVRCYKVQRLLAKKGASFDVSARKRRAE